MSIPWWVAALVVILWLILTRVGRIVGVVAIALLVIIGLQRVFFRTAGACPLGAPCRVELQSSWRGPCFSSTGGAIALEAGKRFLVADGSVAATATCFDIRVYP